MKFYVLQRKNFPAGTQLTEKKPTNITKVEKKFELGNWGCVDESSCTRDLTFYSFKLTTTPGFE